MGGKLDRFSNFFAVREANQFSFDGVNWYKEGDTVCTLANAADRETAVIMEISDQGLVVLKGREYTYTCDAKSILEQKEDERFMSWRSDRICIIKEIREFSIDLTHWYGEGTWCALLAKSALFEPAQINSISDEGKILIDCKGHTYLVDYRDIMSLHDYDEYAEPVMDKACDQTM